MRVMSRVLFVVLLSACSNGVPSCDVREALTNDMVVAGASLPAGTCWTATEPLSLSEGTFTIEEGVSVWFLSDGLLRVGSNAQLRISGSETAPVELSTGDPLVFWRGIEMGGSTGSDNVWTHVHIHRAGSSDWTGASDSAAAVRLEPATNLSMDYVTIEESAAYGMDVYEDVELTFTNGAFIGNDTPAYLDPGAASAIAPETVFLDNTNSFVRLVHGNNDTVERAQTWSALPVPYRVYTRFFVGAPLAVEPGAIVEFEQGASMRISVEGELSALGTAEAPIVFRGADPSQRGFWQGIEVESRGAPEGQGVGAVLDHVSLSNAGSEAWNGDDRKVAGVFVRRGSARITNTSFEDNAGYGMIAEDAADISGFATNRFERNEGTFSVEIDRLTELAGSSSFSDNDTDFVDVFSTTGQTAASATWRAMQVPYRFRDTFSLEGAVTVEAGTALEFTESRTLRVSRDASLTVDGTAELPVTIRGAENRPGFWVGIRIGSNSENNVMRHTVISDTGADSHTGDERSVATIYLAPSTLLELSDVEMQDGAGYGVFVQDDAVLGCDGVTVNNHASGGVFYEDEGTTADTCR